MANKTAPLLPASEGLLRRLGERLRLARLRRRLSATQVAERAGMTRVTLRGIERGAPGATIGAYAAVMQVLGIDKDLDLLASADPLGRELQDARLPIREDRRANEQRPPTLFKAARKPSQPRMEPRASRSPKAPRYESARSLAALIKPHQTGRKGR
jgi:transcriptional regulator with XRE-family HTH domain